MAIGKGSGGGGYGSKPHVQVPVRNGRGASRMLPAGAAQLGQRQGNHFTQGGDEGRESSSYGGLEINAGPMGGLGAIPLGNQVSAETVCKPGGSRTVMRSGSQGMQGAAAPGNPAAKGELFPGWPSKR